MINDYGKKNKIQINQSLLHSKYTIKLIEIILYPKHQLISIHYTLIYYKINLIKIMGYLDIN